MKAQARYKETVGGLLFRLFGEDSDELETKFYEINPELKDHFLAAGQEVNIPVIDTTPESAAEVEQVIEVWE